MSYFMREDSLSRNDSYKLKEIPHLNSPQKISQLNFSHNQIRSIPPHISQALNLQLIDLSHNRITKLEHICEVSSLKFINLSHNLITQIPEDILQLIQIQNLDLGFNKISIMSNIKVLKNLMEVRTFKYQGFLEINLEGNEVLKKKGCRDIYKKWMNPTLDQYHKVVAKRTNYENAINRTQRRISKSLDPELKNKENIMGITNKTLPFTQISTETNINKNNKPTQLNSSKHLISQSRLQHLKLSPNFANHEELKEQAEFSGELKPTSQQLNSQIFKSGYNIKDLSAIEHEKEIGNASEWMNACSQKLRAMTSIFSLIMSNEDLKSLPQQLSEKIINQSLDAKEIIKMSLQALQRTLSNSFSSTKQTKYFQEIEAICNRTKQAHRQTIKLFNDRGDLPIKFYKPWVLYFRQLKQLVSALPAKLELFHSKCLRDQQIQELINISPQKETLKQSPLKSKSFLKEEQNKIDELLFSREKQDFLLLSDCKRSSSQKRLTSRQCQSECQNCLMMKWQNALNKKQLKESRERIQKMEKERQECQAKIKYLEDVKQKYNVLAQKQGLIVDQLQGIQPSTYQNILLEQAKTIEYMIGIEPVIFANFQSKQLQSDKGPLKQSISTALEKDPGHTHLNSSINRRTSAGRNAKKVSEFTVEGVDPTVNPNRGSSYFKNKNVVTTGNRSGEQPKTIVSREDLTTQQNRLAQGTGRGRNYIVVSQFNSEANSFSHSSNKNRHQISIKGIQGPQENCKRRQSIGSNKSKSKPNIQTRNRSITKDHRQMTDNDVILISEQSANKLPPQSKYPLRTYQPNLVTRNAMEAYIKSDEFKQIIDQKISANKHNASQQSKGQKFGGKIQLKNKSQQKRSSSKRITSQPDDSKQNAPTQRVTHSKTADFLDQFYSDRYKQHGYIPMNSLQAQNYKRYMQYHLRNNILDILSKKNGCTGKDLSRLSKKYMQMAKSQRLIHKKHLSQSQTDRSKPANKNKTFR